MSPWVQQQAVDRECGHKCALLSLVAYIPVACGVRVPVPFQVRLLCSLKFRGKEVGRGCALVSQIRVARGVDSTPASADESCIYAPPRLCLTCCTFLSFSCTFPETQCFVFGDISLPEHEQYAFFPLICKTMGAGHHP
jgi:hypothetical protein